jgi:hypothetical protein
VDNELGTSIEADKNLAADLETTCSKKKQNGKKSCLHNVPTVVQKVLLPTPTKPRTTFKCI